MDRLAAFGQSNMPYLVMNYSQKIEIQGHGTYEFNVMNLMNPFTLRIMPMEPTPFNPLYLMAAKVKSGAKS